MKDLAPQRWERLRDLLRTSGVLRVEELCKALHSSSATIRRDLDALEKRGVIRRVHGGAMRMESRLEEPLFDDKTAMAAVEKQQVARAAARLIQPGDTIYLDGGSTVLELARLLRERQDITVVTNSLRAALELSGQGPRVILTGGELRRRSQTMVGVLTRRLLEELHIDRAFMGTMGITLNDGMTTTDANEAYTKELVTHAAREVYLLIDHSKVGKVQLAKAGRLEDVDGVVVDRRCDKDFVKGLKKRNVNVIIAEEN